MNRNAVFAAIRNFESANTELKNLNRRMLNAGNKMERAIRTHNLVYRGTPHHPRTRQNTSALQLVHQRLQNAHQEYHALLTAYTQTRRRLLNAYQRLAQSIRPLNQLPAGWNIHEMNRNQARRTIQNIRALQNAATARRNARLGALVSNAQRRRKARSAHVSLTRSGLPKELASRIAKMAIKNS